MGVFSKMRITVFTPTYNRAYIIGQLYQSLQIQSFKDFEWLVIDDGSTDNTKSLFEKWKLNDNDFPIRYYRFDNVGKQKEINRALDLAQGELFFTVDSDDLLTEDALEKIDKWETSLPKDGSFCGFAGSDGDMEGNPTNPLFEGSYIDATFLNRYPESGMFIGHDRPWVLYTDIHRKFKYPEFEREKFITEAVVWNRMAAVGYKIRCYNDIVYLREHQEIGLTSGIQKILVSNPQGFGLWRKEMMEIFNYGFWKRFKVYYSFFCDVNNVCCLRQAAQYIGAPLWCMVISKIYYRLKHGREKK